MTGVVLKGPEAGQNRISVDGVFVEAGGIPNTGCLPKGIQTNSLGEIITDKEGRTNLPGFLQPGMLQTVRTSRLLFQQEKGRQQH